MKFDLGAVGAGALVGSVAAAATIVVALALRPLTGGGADALLYLVLLGGLGAGGRAAGLRQPAAPLTHGALAAMVALVVVVVAVVGVRAAFGRAQPGALSLVFHLLMAATAGVLGGYLASRRGSAP